MSEATRGGRWPAAAVEGAVLVALFVLHLTSFGPSSPVFDFEVFRQDTRYILERLGNGKPYQFNPQSHILYHWLVEKGYGLWTIGSSPGPESAFRFLKVFTALTGAAFLLALRRLFVELGLALAPRVVLTALAGISVTAWFNFAAFETHSLAVPFVALYLVTIVRMARGDARSLADRTLFVGSLVACGLVRIDLWRFVAVSTVLPVLPISRRHWRSLCVDLVLVVAIGSAGTVWLVHDYLEVPVREVPGVVRERQERRSLKPKLQRVENLRAGNLVRVGRAITVYDFVMPVLKPTHRPATHIVFEDRGTVKKWARGFFGAPLRNFAMVPLTFVPVLGIVLLLAFAAGRTAVGAARGDPLAWLLALQWSTGLLVYTWFNPFEPFLWGLEFLPLEMAAIALAVRGTPRFPWPVALVALTSVVAIHNWNLFYRVFR